MLAAVIVLLLAQAAVPPGGGQGAARPAECGTLEGGKATNVWERAKSPELIRYCDLLASGAAKLASPSMTDGVLAIAADADRAMPGRAAPSVLRGRALARLGHFSEALAALEAAKSKDDRALDEPIALLAWARSLAETGKATEALAAYRALLPRASSLPSWERGRAYVEAGLVAMAAGPGDIDEAIAILRQGARESRDQVQGLAVASLALALDRSGEKAEARATLADRGASPLRSALTDVQSQALGSAVYREVDAMLGLTLEGTDHALAHDAWQKYLDGQGGKGPWADHARQHLAASPRGTRPEHPQTHGSLGGHPQTPGGAR
jgi:tetratricopeptide (TPR) repeat protein